jgi:hypothetical protein
MPAEAGIQSVGDGNNFKDLDSRLRGNDGVFPLATQSTRREGYETRWKLPPSGNITPFQFSLTLKYHASIITLPTSFLGSMG